MNRWIVASLIAASAGLAGCGDVTHFADKPRPATLVDISVYVNDRAASVSPSSVGAGPVIFYVTNSASRTELVTVQPAHGSGSASASTGPINPGSTAQVQVDLAQGTYMVRSSTVGSSAGISTPKPARLRIGAPRPSSNNAVLQP